MNEAMKRAPTSRVVLGAPRLQRMARGWARLGAVEIASAAVLYSAALVSHPPDPFSPAAVVMVIATAAALAGWVATQLQRGLMVRTRPAGWLLLFLVLVLQSGLVAALYGTPFDLWFRGAIPFLFLMLFFPFLEVARRNPGSLLDALLVACCIWLLKIALISGAAGVLVLRGQIERLTYATSDWGSLGLPFSFVGLVLVLFREKKLAPPIRWVLALAFTTIPAFTMYRGQLIIVGCIWLVYLVSRRGWRRLRALSLAIVVATASVWLLARAPLGKVLRARFELLSTELEGSRVAELEYALQEFIEAPILGKGLGFEVPADVTFLGDVSTIKKAGVRSVGYIHNFVAYLLMDLGVAGLLAFVGFVGTPMWAWFRRGRPGGLGIPFQCVTALIALLFWCSVQAQIRVIQSHIVLAALVATLSASQTLKHRYALGPSGRSVRGKERAG